MSYKDGAAFLEELGYVSTEVGQTESNISEWASDEYFVLYDEEDEEKAGTTV